MDLIFITANGIANFARQGVDRDLDPQSMQAGHKLPVKSGDRPGDQWERFSGPIARENEEVVINEVEIDGKGAALIGNGRGRQPTRGDIQRDMPPVVHRRTQLHSDLANDLRPQMQGIASVPPCLKGESWPALRSFPVLCLAYALHLLLVLRVVSLLHFNDFCGITKRSSKLEHYLVDVTPTPVLPWLEGLDNRVIGRVEMLGGVLILRRIAAADMPAFETEAQVYPRIPDSQTILTAIRAGCNSSYVVEMGTLCRQDHFLSDVFRCFLSSCCFLP